MYLRKCRRTVAGEQKDYWQLVESYRTERGPRQQIVAYLGEVEEAAREGVAQAARGERTHQLRLEEREALEWVEVDVRRVRVERVREFGGPWLGLQVMESPGKCSRNSPRSARWTWCCRRGAVRCCGAGAWRSRRSTKRSCSRD